MKIYLAGPVVAEDNTKKLVDDVYQKLIAKFPVDVYRPGLHKVPNEWGITIFVERGKLAAEKAKKTREIRKIGAERKKEEAEFKEYQRLKEKFG